jgi:hypothetical protein
LLVLLFAADSLLPAPLPSKLIESHSTLPPIRITSERKGPEAVVIDTSQPGFPPMLPDKEIAAALSPRLSSEVADVERQPPASLSEQAAKIPDEHGTGGERRRTSMAGREQSGGVKSPNSADFYARARRRPLGGK